MTSTFIVPSRWKAAPSEPLVDRRVARGHAQGGEPLLGRFANTPPVQPEAVGDGLLEIFLCGGREASDSIIDNFGHGPQPYRCNGCSAKQGLDEYQSECLRVLDGIKQRPRAAQQSVTFGAAHEAGEFHG